MGKPTSEDLQKLQDAIAWKNGKGEDVGVLSRIHEIGEAQAAAPDSLPDQT